MTSTLSSDARTIFFEALEGSTVAHLFEAKVKGATDGQERWLHLEGSASIDLTHLTRILVIAIGKAASPMLEAFLEIAPFGSSCDLRGVLIAPSPPPLLPKGFSYFSGGHPYPNEASFAGARAALALLHAAAQAETSRTFCFFLISGGASAMMDLPLNPAISLEDTVAFHRALVAGGGAIAEINCLRKHFSAVKGGRLALAAGQLAHLSLLLSDVPPDRLDALSSGPTLADPTTIEQCRATLLENDLLSRLPRSVRDFFLSPALPETPKPGDIDENFYLVSSSDDLANSALLSAKQLGYTAVIDNRCDDWNYREAADYLLERLRSLQRKHGRVCLISTGEVTVVLPAHDPRASHLPSAPPHGTGGRNLHFALYCALQLKPGEKLAVLSAGSDGLDGNSPAAGAVVDASTLSQNPEEAAAAFERFDSFTLLNRLGATIVTGPTGNNLRDLRVLLAQAID